MSFLFKFIFAVLIVFSSFGKVQATTYLKKQDFLLGLFLAAQVEKQFSVIEDHPDWKRVKKISAELMSHAGPGFIYSFQIIKAPVANAFALPGGFIFITDKLLDMDLSDDELAFLLGHEMSHVSRHHFAKMMKEQGKVNIANAIATVAALLLTKLADSKGQERVVNQGGYKKAGAPEIGDVTSVNLPPYMIPVLTGNIFGTLYLLHSQRELEFDADYHGALLAMQAGYSLKNGMGMLEKLFYSNYRDKRYVEWQTHPLTLERTQKLKALNTGHRSLIKNSETYVKDLQEKYALNLMEAYEQCILWKKPTYIKSGFKVNQIRKIVLDRAKRFANEKETERLILRKEIFNQILPSVKRTPFLRAQYGFAYHQLLKLRELGGLVDDGLLKEIKIKADASLKHHVTSMKATTPGYKQLKFMLENYPKHDSLKKWQWLLWMKEPNLSKKIEKASEEGVKTHSDFYKELDKMLGFVEENPLQYAQIMKLKNEDLDKKVFLKYLNECKSIKVLAEFQHEYKEHIYLDEVMKRKLTLMKEKFNAGKLAAFSHQKHRAVRCYHDVLLYGSNGELEDDAKHEIYKLNTVQDLKKY